MRETLYASFADIADAERATGALLDFGLKSDAISLIAHHQHEGRKEYYQTYGVAPIGGYTDPLMTTAVIETVDRPHNELDAKTGISTTTAADAAAGAAKGTGIGLGVGAALAVAALFVPGVGLVVGGGALALALAGAAGATGAGAVAGGALGYLKDQGVPDHAVAHYTETFDNGGALLAITTADDVSLASVKEILSKYNAQNVGEYGHLNRA